MRTLKQEIAYCREKGFCRNTIELSTMLAWLGERVVEDDERKELVAALESERIKTAVVFDSKAVWQAIPDRVKEWTNVDHLTAVLDAVAKVMKRSNAEVSRSAPLLAQVGSTDGLGVAVSPAPTFGDSNASSK